MLRCLILLLVRRQNGYCMRVLGNDFTFEQKDFSDEPVDYQTTEKHIDS